MNFEPSSAVFFFFFGNMHYKNLTMGFTSISDNEHWLFQVNGKYTDDSFI